MIVDLVKVRTSDGMTLHGALHASNKSSEVADGIDVILGLPGVGGNFYDSSFGEELTPHLTARGIDVLWVNTRGHGRISVVKTDRGPVAQGSAYEIVDECRFDVSAWLDWLQGRGYRRIAIVGHSLGAIKALYSQAFARHSAADCLVAVSPPRLSCAAFRVGEQANQYFEDLDRAQRSVADGKSREMMRTRVPFPMLMSAGTFVDKYGPEERYNLLGFLDRVSCPHAFVYGAQELEHGGIAFAGMPDAIRGLPDRPFQAPVFTIAGANHMYAGCHADLAETLLDWLGDRRPAS